MLLADGVLIPASPYPSARVNFSSKRLPGETVTLCQDKQGEVQNRLRYLAIFFSGIFTLSMFGYFNLSDISSALVRPQGSDTGREEGQYVQQQCGVSDWDSTNTPIYGGLRIPNTIAVSAKSTFCIHHFHPLKKTSRITIPNINISTPSHAAGVKIRSPRCVVTEVHPLTTVPTNKKDGWDLNSSKCDCKRKLRSSAVP